MIRISFFAATAKHKLKWHDVFKNNGLRMSEVSKGHLKIHNQYIYQLLKENRDAACFMEAN
jgi:hypothetical protein